MKVIVTQHHINQANKGSPSTNPIALAVMDHGYSDVFTTGSMLIIRHQSLNGAVLERFPMPQEAVTFQTRFESGEPVTPFNFDTYLIPAGSRYYRRTNPDSRLTPKAI